MTELKVSVETHVLMSGEGENAVWSPMPSALQFTQEDPVAATLVVGVGEPNAVPWVFAFDLVYRASTGWSRAGVGDVRFGVDELNPDWLVLRLASPDGSATLRLRALDVKRYVQRVRAMLDAQPSVDIVSQSLEKTISAILEGST